MTKSVNLLALGLMSILLFSSSCSEDDGQPAEKGKEVIAEVT